MVSMVTETYINLEDKAAAGEGGTGFWKEKIVSADNRENYRKIKDYEKKVKFNAGGRSLRNTIFYHRIKQIITKIDTTWNK